MRDQNKLHLIFIRADDEFAVSDPEFQQSLRSFSSSLFDGRVIYSQRVKSIDSATGCGYLLGEYFISLAQVIGPNVGAAVGLWIKERAGRKVLMRVGSIELETNSSAEIVHLFSQAIALKADSAE